MTSTDTVKNRWDDELSRIPRRGDGRRELRQFHTAADAVARVRPRPAGLSRAATAALAAGNGAVMGVLLGSLFGAASGVVAGVLAAVVGYVWISGFERKDR